MRQWGREGGRQRPHILSRPFFLFSPIFETRLAFFSFFGGRNLFCGFPPQLHLLLLEVGAVLIVQRKVQKVAHREQAVSEVRHGGREDIGEGGEGDADGDAVTALRLAIHHLEFDERV